MTKQRTMTKSPKAPRGGHHGARYQRATARHLGTSSPRDQPANA